MSSGRSLWATCLSTHISSIPEHLRVPGEGADFTYPLTVGKRYRVAAMIWVRSSLQFVVRNDYNQLETAYEALFSLNSRVLPAHWQFARIDDQPTSAHRAGDVVWGFPEFVNDGVHVLHSDDPVAAVRVRTAVWRDEVVSRIRDVIADLATVIAPKAQFDAVELLAFDETELAMQTVTWAIVDSRNDVDPAIDEELAAIAQLMDLGIRNPDRL